MALFMALSGSLYRAASDSMTQLDFFTPSCSGRICIRVALKSIRPSDSSRAKIAKGELQITAKRENRRFVRNRCERSFRAIFSSVEQK